MTGLQARKARCNIIVIKLLVVPHGASNCSRRCLHMCLRTHQQPESSRPSPQSQMLNPTASTLSSSKPASLADRRRRASSFSAASSASSGSASSRLAPAAWTPEALVRIGSTKALRHLKVTWAHLKLWSLTAAHPSLTGLRAALPMPPASELCPTPNSSAW